MAHPSYQNNGGITAPPLPQVVAAAHVRTLPFAELHELRKQENLNWEVPPIWLLDRALSVVVASPETCALDKPPICVAPSRRSLASSEPSSRK